MSRTAKTEDFELYQSVVTAVADPVSIEGLRCDFRHHTFGVQFFSDAAGTTPATPGAGTVVLAVETLTNGAVAEVPSGSPIDATSPVSEAFTGHAKKVTATPSGVTTATHYKLVAVASEY